MILAACFVAGLVAGVALSARMAEKGTRFYIARLQDVLLPGSRATEIERAVIETSRKLSGTGDGRVFLAYHIGKALSEQDRGRSRMVLEIIETAGKQMEDTK